MRFDPPERIDYAHAPPAGPARASRRRRAGTTSTEVDGGTHLRISLTMHVDLPLARAARPAVKRVMSSMMQRTGDRFADNLLRHLGVPR